MAANAGSSVPCNTKFGVERASMENIRRVILRLSVTVAVSLTCGVAGVGVVLLLPRLGHLAIPMALALPVVPCVLLLCWFKFDLMVFVALALSSVVIIEPAPVDLLLTLLLVIGLFKGRLSLRRLQNATLVHLATWVLGLTNLFALIQPYPAPASAVFAAVSIYLLASMYLVKMYVVTPYHGYIILAGYCVAGWIAVAGAMLAYTGLPGTQFLLYGEVRARGFFKDPNVFGPFLVPLFVLMLDELIDPTWPQVPVLVKGLTLTLSLIGVFLSYSRAAWANLGIAVFLYTGVSLLTKRHAGRLLTVLSIIGTITLLLASILLVARPDLVDMLKWRLTLIQRYDTFRFARQQEGITTAFTHPIGLGPGTFGGAHQLYIKTLAEQGVLGFLALLTLLLGITLGVLQAAFKSSKVYGLSSTALLAGLMGTLANGFLIDAIHWRHLYLLLGLSWVASVDVAQSGWMEEHEHRNAETWSVNER